MEIIITTPIISHGLGKNIKVALYPFMDKGAGMFVDKKGGCLKASYQFHIAGTSEQVKDMSEIIINMLGDSNNAI